MLYMFGYNPIRDWIIAIINNEYSLNICVMPIYAYYKYNMEDIDNSMAQCKKC